MIRSYDPADASRLFAIHSEAFSGRQATAEALDGRLRHLVDSGGCAWVLQEEQDLVGYAVVSPLPGLDRVMTLEGFIDPARRRRGFGRRLLQHVLHSLKQSGVRQLSYGVTSLDSPAAHFLLANRFFIEHEEWQMKRSLLLDLPASPAADLRTFPRAVAIGHFCSLYDQSFGGKPWYQPYSPAEVEATLHDPGDLIFLVTKETPIGFVWVRQSNGGAGEIEPIGVAEGYQGQGHGRTLLLAGLHSLKHQGVEVANIGVWRENQAAIHLYQELGFRHVQTLTYLAFNL